VEADRFRFDFTHFQAMDETEIAMVEDMVNEKILECIHVKIEEKAREDAIREGATALFEEKYGEKVRVVRIGDFSAELCGGTHVKNTGEIGCLYIINESSLASGVRRIEAVTGKGAVLYKRRLEGILKAISRHTNTEMGRLEDRVLSLVDDLKEREKVIERLKEEIMTFKVEEALKTAKIKDGAKIVSMFLGDAKADELRKVSDIIRGKEKNSVVAVGSSTEDKGIIIVAVSKNLQNQYNAGKIIKALTERFSGKGGGGPQIAQGGVPGSKVMDALKEIHNVL